MKVWRVITLTAVVVESKAHFFNCRDLPGAVVVPTTSVVGHAFTGAEVRLATAVHEQRATNVHSLPVENSLTGNGDATVARTDLVRSGRQPEISSELPELTRNGAISRLLGLD
jgi:uncharacterized protein GlcG (DUF336 family)